MNFVARSSSGLPGKEMQWFDPQAACNAVEESNRCIDAVQKGSSCFAAGVHEESGLGAFRGV